MGELELMLRRPHTVEEYQAALASALEEVGRLSKVVEGLLELSRAESGQVQLEWELFDLSELVASVTDDVAVLAEEHGITLTATLQPYVRIVGDRTRLQQVVINVLDNAVKYTPHGGSVAIQLSIEDAAAVLTVRDTGIGIPPEDLPRIFDRFYRVDKARHRTAGGSGLGLSIVQWIIHAHHGSISVESAEGVGTTVTIRLLLDGRDGAVQLSEERVQPLRNQ
jgi:signal transduction histidine kinase